MNFSCTLAGAGLETVEGGLGTLVVVIRTVLSVTEGSMTFHCWIAERSRMVLPKKPKVHAVPPPVVVISRMEALLRPLPRVASSGVTYCASPK